MIIKRALTAILAVFTFTTAMPSVMLAAQSVRIKIPSFNVNLNGTSIDPLNREHPLIVYKDITYFPMTYYDCRYLGLETSWSEQYGLKVINTGISSAFMEQIRDKANNSTGFAKICEFPVKVNKKYINNAYEEYPLLVFRDVTYIPLTWRLAVDEFGWEYSYNESDGLKIRSSSKAALIFAENEIGDTYRFVVQPNYSSVLDYSEGVVCTKKLLKTDGVAMCFGT